MPNFNDNARALAARVIVLKFTRSFRGKEDPGLSEKLRREMAGVFDAPIVTEIAPLDVFYAADSSHQDYFDRNRFQPYCAFVISPKVSKLRKQHADLLAPEFA